MINNYRRLFPRRGDGAVILRTPPMPPQIGAPRSGPPENEPPAQRSGEPVPQFCRNVPCSGRTDSTLFDPKPESPKHHENLKGEARNWLGQRRGKVPRDRGVEQEHSGLDSRFRESELGLNAGGRRSNRENVQPVMPPVQGVRGLWPSAPFVGSHLNHRGRLDSRRPGPQRWRGHSGPVFAPHMPHTSTGVGATGGDTRWPQLDEQPPRRVAGIAA